MTAKKADTPEVQDDQVEATFTTERMTITFVKPHGRYSRGDVAGFEADQAKRLVKMNVAVEGDKLPPKSKEA